MNLPQRSNSLRKFTCPEILFGIGALNNVINYIRNFNASNVFLVSDEGVIKAGWTEQIQNILEKDKINFFLYSNITENPKSNEVEKGAVEYLKNQCDIILIIGGGSPIDCGKSIGIMVSNQKNILEFEGVDEIEIPGPPVICIPTTAGSSADISQFAIITDEKTKSKVPIVSKYLIPDVSIIDPVTTTTLNSELTAATGMDALGHAIEAYVSKGSSVLTDINSMKAIELVNDNILNAVKDNWNLEYRNNMMQASMLAGLAFSNASLGIVHAMAHTIGGYLDNTHGECIANLLSPGIKINFQEAKYKYLKIAEAMNLPVTENNCLKLLTDRIEFLINETGIKKTFSLKNHNSEVVKKLAETTYYDPCMLTNPAELSIKEIAEKYEEILQR